MPMPGIAAAKRLCELSGWNLTNLEIQKILYIAQMLHLGKHGADNPLISDTFEAWDFGPVVPAVYHKLKIFGAEKVSNVFRRVGDLKDENAGEALHQTFEAIRSASASQLVAFTHDEIGAWAHYYEPNVKGTVIPNKAIAREYHDRAYSQAA